MKHSPEEQERRANEARGILDHPLFVEALRSVEASLKHARERAPLTDVATHTKLILMEQCQAQLVEYLRNVMMTGELAKATLLREGRALQRMQAAFRRGLRL
jgi:glycine cleavage system aminomethyltransferase T